jgi:nucleotide-binding universal stress UspA family protein
MQGATEALYEQHVDAMRRQARAILNHAAELATAAGVPFETILREVKVGRAGEAIAAEAANGYDLLVIGTHGRRGLQRLLLGSDAELVLRTAPIPVLLVRG